MAEIDENDEERRPRLVLCDRCDGLGGNPDSGALCETCLGSGLEASVRSVAA